MKLKVGNDDEENLLDHHLYLVFVLLVKLSVHCPAMLNDQEYREQIGTIADIAQCLLCHEHEWVRVGAVQFLGALFSEIDPEVMALAVNGGCGDVRFWDSSDFSGKIRSLVLDHTAQFVPGAEITQEFTEQVSLNFFFVGIWLIFWFFS